VDLNNHEFLKPEDVQILLELSASADSNWEIVVASPEEALLSTIKDIFVDDYLVKVKGVQNGCDFLVMCAREMPDLVILDEALSDIPLGEIVKCIRRTPSLKDIKVLCNLNTIAPSEMEPYGVDDLITPDKCEKIHLSRKVNSLLYTSTLHHNRRQKPNHERRWPRIDLNIKTRIEVIDSISSIRYDNGEAIIENISREGAYITQIQLKKGVIPEGTFQIRLRVNQHPLPDWKAESVVMRVGENAVGVKFENISKEDTEKIMDIFE
jgi:hypothetical protein